jgi:DNA-binding CsgD family transcriptional regulator/tetratricopeptide (TPR) repeat protein
MTLDLLAALTARMNGQRLLLAVTLRTDEPTQAAVAVPAVGRLARATGITLQPLGHDDARRLAGALIGSDSPAATEGVVAFSGGNPFYIEELITSDGGPGGRSATLTATILGRLRVLGEQARSVVELVAIGDSPVDYADLLGASGFGEDPLDAALEEARAHGLLTFTPTSPIRFRHALVGEAVRDEVPPGRTRALHRAWADSLGRSPATPHRALAAAMHWNGAGDDSRALGAAMTGARAASQLGAYDAQAKLLDQVAALWPADQAKVEGADRIDVLQQSARAHQQAGDIDAAMARLDRALDLADPVAEPERVADLLVDRGTTPHDGDPFADFQQALHVLPASGSERARGRVLAAWADACIGSLRPFEVAEPAEEAIRLARSSGDLASEALALKARAHALDYTDSARAVAEHRRAIAAAQAADDRVVAVQTMGNLVALLCLRGELEASVAEGEASLRAANRMGLEMHPATGAILTIVADSLRELGRLDQADEVAADAQERLTGRGLSNFAVGVRALVRLMRGDGDAAAALADLQVMTGYEQYERALDPVRAWLTWAREGAAAAADQTMPFLRAGVDAGGRTRLFTESETLFGAIRYARLAGRLDDPTSSDVTVVRQLRDLARTQVPLLPLTDVAHAALTAADGADPADRWRSAVDVFDRAEGPIYWRIDTRLRLAESTTDRAEAVAVLDLAEREARQIGSTPQLDEIDTLRRRVGALPAPGDLTPREVEVALLVTDGLTNRQIGERLFISAKTAGVHVSNILTKTRLTSRYDIADWASANGLSHGP